MVIEVLFLWCVQEVAELKEEDIISHTAATEPLTAAAPPPAPSGDPYRTLSESTVTCVRMIVLNVTVILLYLQPFVTCLR